MDLPLSPVHEGVIPVVLLPPLSTAGLVTSRTRIPPPPPPPAATPGLQPSVHAPVEFAILLCSQRPPRARGKPLVSTMKTSMGRTRRMRFVRNLVSPDPGWRDRCAAALGGVRRSKREVPRGDEVGERHPDDLSFRHGGTRTEHGVIEACSRKMTMTSKSASKSTDQLLPGHPSLVDKTKRKRGKRARGHKRR